MTIRASFESPVRPMGAHMDLSAGSLFASLLVSSVGFGFFIYGKKQACFPQLFIGIAMMVYPYFVPDPLAMLGIAGALVVGLVVALRRGV